MRIAPNSGRQGRNNEGAKGNILEQFFRGLKRAHRRRTGIASSRRMLRTILAETPLARNTLEGRTVTLGGIKVDQS
jgi:hypothetical protein